jgi:hypothetical protein
VPDLAAAPEESFAVACFSRNCAHVEKRLSQSIGRQRHLLQFFR